MQKVLIIDDDETTRKAMQRKFSMNQFLVSEASNGKAGLEFALETHPDIILLDIRMPKIDGLTVMETLRHDEWGKNVPIIILTNLNLDDSKIQYVVKDHPAYYLEKANSSIDEIVTKAKEVLKLE